MPASAAAPPRSRRGWRSCAAEPACCPLPPWPQSSWSPESRPWRRCPAGARPRRAAPGCGESRIGYRRVPRRRWAREDVSDTFFSASTSNGSTGSSRKKMPKASNCRPSPMIASAVSSALNIDHDIDRGANGLAHRSDAGDVQLRGLPGDGPGRHVPDVSMRILLRRGQGIELDRGIAVLDHAPGLPSELIRCGAAKGPPVGVDPSAVAALATEQLVDGYAKRFPAYLCYRGARTLLRREDAPAWAPVSKTATRLAAQGFLVNLLNPKTALFFFRVPPSVRRPRSWGRGRPDPLVRSVVCGGGVLHGWGVRAGRRDGRVVAQRGPPIPPNPAAGERHRLSGPGIDGGTGGTETVIQAASPGMPTRPAVRRVDSRPGRS